jgi:hypothetical protein
MSKIEIGSLVESDDSSSHDTYEIVNLSEDGEVSWCINTRTRAERRIPVHYLLPYGRTEDE